MSGPELFEALDAKGRPTGELKTRQQILADGDYRNVVHVWIVDGVDDQDYLWAQQRAEKGAGLWDNLWDVSVGGGVRVGEAPIRSAVRELEEELGLTVEASDLDNLGRWDTSKPLSNTGKMAYEFSHSFLLRRRFSREDFQLQKEEVADVRKVPFVELKEIASGKERELWVPHPAKYYLGVVALIKARHDG